MAQDSLHKTLKDVPVGKKLPFRPPKQPKQSDRLDDRIASKVRNGVKGSIWNYDHLIPRVLRNAGYGLSIYHLEKIPGQSSNIFATLKHNDKAVGFLESHLLPDATLHFEHSLIDPKHRGKGLGRAMYEGVAAHAVNKLAAKYAVGDIHSTMASKIHRWLSSKHGLNYKPRTLPYSKGVPVGPYDARFDKYQYKLK